MYNKQAWLDEIPDMTRPIMDPSTGKQKTDPQTGRPLYDLVQAGTRITSNRLNTMEGGIEAAHTLVEQLAKEMGGDFVAVIDGLMGLSCSAEGLKAMWTAGVAYVGGRRYEVSAGEMALNPTQGQYLYVDLDGVIKKTTSQETAKAGLLLLYVATDTSGVITSTDQRVNISLDEILKKIENVEIPNASLTEAGKVQLSNKIDGDSEELAPTEKALNDARLAAQKYADDKTWQKFPLTQDNGDAKTVTTGQNLNILRTPGIYYGAPQGVPNYNGQMYIVEVFKYTDNVVIQRATNLDINEVYERVYYSSTWKEWKTITPKDNIWGAL